MTRVSVSIVGFVIAAIAILVVTFYAISVETVWPFLGLLLVLPAVYLVTHPETWLALVIVLYASDLTFPGLPQNINAYYTFAAGLSLALLARRGLVRQAFPRWTAAHWLAAFFAAVLLLTAMVRGFGLRSFGTQTWGGAGYILLLISVGLLLVSGSAVLTQRQWTWALVGMSILSLLPPLAQGAYALSGGRVYQQFQFIVSDVSADVLLRNIQEGTDILRVQPAHVASSFLCLLALLVGLRPRPRRLLMLLLIAASFALAGVSGHRVAVIYNLLMVVFFLFLERKERVFGFLGVYVAVFLTALLAMAFWAQHLPQNFQRSLAWIPYADITPEARMSAQDTSGWRIEIWRTMLRQVPDYLGIGKGFAFTGDDVALMTSAAQAYTPEQAIASHNYHNGPLSLLLDLGLPGLVLGFGFVAAILVRHSRRTRAPWSNLQLRHYHRVFLASFIAQALIFLLIHGDARSSFTAFILWLIVLEGLARSDDAQALLLPAPAPPVTS